MRLLKQHELIAPGASPEEVERILSTTSFRAVKRTLAILTGNKESLLRKSRNLKDLGTFELDEVIDTYNYVALTINYNVKQAIAMLKQAAVWLPQLLKIKSLQGAIDLVADADEPEDEEETA